MKKYHYKYKNKTVFLIGNGASLSRLRNDLIKELKSRYYIAACNYWYPFGKEIFNIDPHFYCIGDMINIAFKPYKKCKDLIQVKDTSYNKIYENYYNSYFNDPLLKNLIEISPLDYIKINKLNNNFDSFYVSTQEFNQKSIIDSLKNYYNNYNILHGFKISNNDLNYQELIQNYSKHKIDENLGIYFIKNKLYLHRKLNVIFSYYIRLLCFLGFKNIVLLGIDCSRSGYFYNPLDKFINNDQYFKSNEFLENTHYYNNERIKLINNKLKSLENKYKVNFYYYNFNYPFHYGKFGIKIKDEKQLLNFYL